LVLCSKNCVIARQPTSLAPGGERLGAGEVPPVSGPDIVPDAEIIQEQGLIPDSAPKKGQAMLHLAWAAI
jgi:hypothetical protein